MNKQLLNPELGHFLSANENTSNLLDINAFPYGILIADTNKLITSVNDAFCLMTGFSKSEIIGRPCSFVQGPGTDSKQREAIRVDCKNEKIFNGEILNFKKDGSSFWNELTIQPMRNPIGEISGYIGISRDITLRKRAEIDSAKEFSILREHSQGVPGMAYQFRIKPDGSVSLPFIGEASHEIYGISPDDLKASPSHFFDWAHPDDHKQLWDSVLESKKNLTVWTEDYRVNVPGQPVRWLHGNSQPERQSDGSTLWHGYVTDITQRKNLEEKILEQAFHDTLTGLANRRLFYDRLDQAMKASHRTGHFGAIINIDLDRFKPVNDLYGHTVGDAFLVETAKRLKHCVRVSDTVARFGGDEFIIMLTELSEVNSESLAQATQVAEKLRAALSEMYSLIVQHEGSPDEIIRQSSTASIGVAIFQGNQVEPDQLLKSADRAMYRAKKQGGGLVRFQEP